MCTRSLRFVLLVWLVGVLHAQTGQQVCLSPSLNHGYISPHRSTFLPDTELKYACDLGYKPIVKGWWAEVTCQNGKWSHEPKCIEENDCTPPTIPNAGYVENADGWFAQGTELMITCNNGYEHKSQDTSVRCDAGRWTSLPKCEKSADSCDAPPVVLHAVIISEMYRDVFAANSKLQYQCKDGYRTEDGQTKKTITCEAGIWTKGPTCTRLRTDSGTNIPETGRQPANINTCGPIPTFENGDVINIGSSYFEYTCAAHYEKVGSDRVTCYSDGSWSHQPGCIDSYCIVDTGRDRVLVNVGQQYIGNGKKLRLECVTGRFESAKYSDILCTNRHIRPTPCCTAYYLDRNNC